MLAVRGETITSPLKAGTTHGHELYARRPQGHHYADVANPDRLIHRNAFNIASMSFDPEDIYAEIRKHRPDFEMVYDIDPLKQCIADSWPDRMDDSCAREEWDWHPTHDLTSMTQEMLEKLSQKLGGSRYIPTQQHLTKPTKPAH
jgi:nucleoside-diphosphate-sugar epimerase